MDSRGRRGGQGARVLAFPREEMLAFDWTFPPDVPRLRLADAKPQVVVLLEDHGDGARVSFVQHGWQDSKDRAQGYACFDQAWDHVLQTMMAHLKSSAGAG